MSLDKSKILKNAVESSLYQYPYQNLSLIDMVGEIWKPVPDFEDYYEVSNLGRIKSLERNMKLNINSNYSHQTPPKILKQRLRIFSSRIKSLTTRLNVENTETHITVKNLVYNTFVKEVNVRDYQVFPLDGNEANCRVTNLDSRPRRRRDRKLQALQEKWKKEVHSNTARRRCIFFMALLLPEPCVFLKNR